MVTQCKGRGCQWTPGFFGKLSGGGPEEARTALLQFIIYVSKSCLRIIGTLRALSSQHYGDKDGKFVPPGLDSKTLSQRGWGGKDTEKLSNTPNWWSCINQLTTHWHKQELLRYPAQKVPGTSLSAGVLCATIRVGAALVQRPSWNSVVTLKVLKRSY